MKSGHVLCCRVSPDEREGVDGEMQAGLCECVWAAGCGGRGCWCGWGLRAGGCGELAAPETVVDVLHRVVGSGGGDLCRAGDWRCAGGRERSGVVEVEFRVDQAVRGCAAGGPYMLREWAGLWAAGNQRYRVGQRLLMMLHAPGAAGMSSPVGGMDGAIPIRRVGSAVRSETCRRLLRQRP